MSMQPINTDVLPDTLKSWGTTVSAASQAAIDALQALTSDALSVGNIDVNFYTTKNGWNTTPVTTPQVFWSTNLVSAPSPDTLGVDGSLWFRSTSSTTQVVYQKLNGVWTQVVKSFPKSTNTGNPTPEFTALVKDLSVSFDGSLTSTVEGVLVQYDWDFGDGSTHGTTKTCSHVYSLDGTFQVILKVTNDQGLSATTTKSVTTKAPAVSFTLRKTQPVASNTGAGVPRPKPTTSLPVNTATTLSTTGATYTGQYFTNDVVVTSPNISLIDCYFAKTVTFKSSNGRMSNFVVVGGAGKTGNQWLVKCTAGTNTYLEYGTLHPSNPYDGWNGIGERNFTAYRCEIYNTVDGMSMYPAAAGQAVNASAQGCYIHDLLQFAPDTQNGNRAQTHNDGIQIQGGSGAQVIGNNILAANATGFGSVQYNPQINKSCVMLNRNIGNLTGVVIEDNWFDWGIISVNGTGLGSGDSIASLKRNKFGPNSISTSAHRPVGLNKLASNTIGTGADKNYYTSTGGEVPYYYN